MKMRLYAVIILSVLLSSCHKTTDNPVVVKMADLTVPYQFGWNATQTITLHLTNVPAGVVRVSSVGESELYLKAMGDGITKEMDLSVIIPTHASEIKINSYPVQITSDYINFDFPVVKESQVTNYAMNFNGTNAWVKVAGATNLSFTSQYSVSAWVKAGRHQTAKIIQKGDWDGLGLGQDLWNGWQTSVAFSDGTSALVNWGLGRPVLNQWYYLAGTYDGTTLKLYVNGTVENFVAVSKPIRTNNRFISIGSDAGNQKFFQGLLDDVSIWNLAMTQTQVTTGRTIGFTGGETGILGYWKFNEASGNTCYDMTTSHFDGVNTGGTYSTDVGYALTVDSDNDGVPDTYDDYPLDNSRAFNNFIPSSGYNTLIFEDLWPGQGDYDFNDLVAGYEFNTITNAQNKIVETKANFIVRAIGGSFRNGFGFQFTGSSIPSSAINCTGYSLKENYITLMSNGLEAQQAHPTIIVFDNAYNILPGQSGSTGVNVEPGKPYIAPDTIKIHLTYPPNTYTLNQLNQTAFNPFLIINKTRGREVHLPDYVPTSLADPLYFGTVGDDSKPSSNRYYKTKTSLPWAMNLPDNFEYPVEKQDILTAYLKMASWAQSGGTDYFDWYQDIPGYRDITFVYQH
jgi:LruC domain-containing protein